MKKIFLIVLVLIGFNLFADEQSEWMNWFKDRNWVLENNIEVPIYETLHTYIKNDKWSYNQVESGEHYISITGLILFGNEIKPVLIIYSINKDPIQLKPIYMSVGIMEGILLLYVPFENKIIMSYLQDNNLL